MGYDDSLTKELFAASFGPNLARGKHAMEVVRKMNILGHR